MARLHRIDSGVPDHCWHSVLVFNCRRPGAGVHQLRGGEGIQRPRARDWLAHLPARDCAGVVLRFCTKPNVVTFVATGLCRITLILSATEETARRPVATIISAQASPGSGPSESEGTGDVLTAPRRSAGIRQPNASQK